jgi:hypothetical protein
MRTFHGDLRLFLDGEEIPIANLTYEANHNPTFFDVSMVAYPADSMIIRLRAQIPRDNVECNTHRRAA